MATPSGDDGPDKAIRSILESYVLDVLGALPPEKVAEVEALTREQLDGPDDADWRTLLRSKLELPDDFDASLRGMWQANRESTSDAGFDIEPEQFAWSFVGRYFSS